MDTDTLNYLIQHVRAERDYQMTQARRPGITYACRHAHAVAARFSNTVLVGYRRALRNLTRGPRDCSVPLYPTVEAYSEG